MFETNGFFVPGIFSDFLSTPIPGLDFTIDGANIAFTFDALGPGNEILIAKVLECMDPAGCSIEDIRD